MCLTSTEGGDGDSARMRRRQGARAPAATREGGRVFLFRSKLVWK
jgi:hypothetical protein